MESILGHHDPEGLDRHGGRAHATRILRASAEGRDEAAAEMLEIAYAELRFFGGLETSDSTIERDWRVARAFLHQHQATSDAD